MRIESSGKKNVHAHCACVSQSRVFVVFRGAGSEESATRLAEQSAHAHVSPRPETAYCVQKPSIIVACLNECSVFVCFRTLDVATRFVSKGAQLAHSH
jgi:hypothetical protein